MSEREALVARLREQAARANRAALKEKPSEAELRGVIGGMYIVIKDAIAALSAPQQEPVAESHCVWMQDSDGPWNTSCGHVFEFTDGGPHQNDAAWCQYCGGKLLPTYHDVEQESVERNAALLAAAKEQVNAEGQPADGVVVPRERQCNMIDGPSIPWALGEALYAGYVAIGNGGQSIETLNERGGFGWAEVAYMWAKHPRREIFKATVKAALLAAAKEPTQA